MKIILDENINGKYFGLIQNENKYKLVVNEKAIEFTTNNSTTLKIATELFNEVVRREKEYSEIDAECFLDTLLTFTDCGELGYLFTVTNSKEFAEEKVYELLDLLEFVPTICNNERLGEEAFGWTTIQVALEEDGDYIGEFIGEDGKNNFEFILYED